MTWAPTGDKLVYMTKSGKLYWCNYDGTNPTLLHDYGDLPSYDLLDQMPLGDTLVVPGYLIRFTSGQPPSLQEAPDTLGVHQIRWWRSDRASGIITGGYDGSEQLVTFDVDGKRIDKRNIPYMASGVVQPGGVWFAYATEYHRAYYAPDPATVYMLNLSTNRRLQITEVGDGNSVSSWSPDGTWFLMEAFVNDTHGTLVSSDGQEWVVVTPSGGASDAVWRSDSRRLAYSVEKGGREPGCAEPCSRTSEVFIVDVPTRKKDKLDKVGSSANPNAASSMMMHPSWSPNGALMTFLSFDPDCLGCSGITPAFYLMNP